MLKILRFRQKTTQVANAEVEEQIARQHRTDLERWFELHRSDLLLHNGSSSEFKLK